MSTRLIHGFNLWACNKIFGWINPFREFRADYNCESLDIRKKIRPFYARFAAYLESRGARSPIRQSHAFKITKTPKSWMLTTSERYSSLKPRGLQCREPRNYEYYQPARGTLKKKRWIQALVSLYDKSNMRSKSAYHYIGFSHCFWETFASNLTILWRKYSVSQSFSTWGKVIPRSIEL